MADIAISTVSVLPCLLGLSENLSDGLLDTFIFQVQDHFFIVNDR